MLRLREQTSEYRNETSTKALTNRWFNINCGNEKLLKKWNCSVKPETSVYERFAFRIFSIKPLVVLIRHGRHVQDGVLNKSPSFVELLQNVVVFTVTRTVTPLAKNVFVFSISI